MALLVLTLKIPLCIVSFFLISAIAAGIFLLLYFTIQGRKVMRIRTSRIYYTFLMCMLFPIFWCSGQLFELYFGKQESGPIFLLEYSAVCFGALVWLLFCLRYVENKLLDKKRNIYFLIILPAFFYLCVLTNDFHKQFTYFVDENREYGIFFKMHFVVFITYALAGVILLFKYSIKRKLNSRVLSNMLILSFFLPVTLTTVKVLGWIKFDIVFADFVRENFDLSSASFMITMVIFTIAFFRYRLLNIKPIAMSHVFRNISESIMVIDENNNIISINKSFEDNFPGFIDSVNQKSLNYFVEYFEEVIEDLAVKRKVLQAILDKPEEEVVEEICVINEFKRHYTLIIRPMYHNDIFIGRIISFSDISEHKLLLEDLNSKNDELSILNNELFVMNLNLVDSNKKIKEYAEAVRELTLIKERNRFARDVHDTLGHSMVILIALLEASRLSVLNDGPKTDKILEKAIYTARNGLNEIRKSLKNLVEESTEESLMEKLESLIMEYEITGIKIDFSVDEGIENISAKVSRVIFRICQESITNSIKHGKATKMSFVLKVFESSVKLYVFDNGVGCSDIKLGMGLMGMKQRIEELNGSLSVLSRANNGFNITVELPVCVNSDDEVFS